MTSGTAFGSSDSWTDDDVTTGSSESYSESVTRSTIPVTRHIERLEEASRTFWGLDEDWERVAGWIMRQQDQRALVHIRGQRPMRMITRYVAPPQVTSEFVAYRANEALQRCARSREEVEAEICGRRSGTTSSNAEKKPESDKKRQDKARDIPQHTQYEEQE